MTGGAIESLYCEGDHNDDERAAMMRPLRWGIMSTGGIAQRFTRDLQLIDEGVAVAVGSRSMSSADRFADEFDIPHRHDSYESLVDDPDVDVIYVATPHPMHFENGRLALEHGKAVLVEKAFTMTGDEARTLVALARERGLFMMEAMWTRCLPHVKAIRDLVDAGHLGRLVSVEADHGQWFNGDPGFRLFAPELGGGALLDLGVYPISFASMLLGPPSSVSALIQPAFTGVDGSVSMSFGYDSGAQSTLSCTSAAKTATRACISGTEARIEVDSNFYAPTAFTLISRDGTRERFEFSTEGRGLHFEASEVARCISEGLTESPLMPLDETISIMDTMEQVLSFQ